MKIPIVSFFLEINRSHQILKFEKKPPPTWLPEENGVRAMREEQPKEILKLTAKSR